MTVDYSKILQQQLKMSFIMWNISTIVYYSKIVSNKLKYYNNN
jgi:hypothetical protein